MPNLNIYPGLAISTAARPLAGCPPMVAGGMFDELVADRDPDNRTEHPVRFSGRRKVIGVVAVESWAVEGGCAVRVWEDDQVAATIAGVPFEMADVAAQVQAVETAALRLARRAGATIDSTAQTRPLVELEPGGTERLHVLLRNRGPGLVLARTSELSPHDAEFSAAQELLHLVRDTFDEATPVDELRAKVAALFKDMFVDHEIARLEFLDVRRRKRRGERLQRPAGDATLPTVPGYLLPALTSSHPKRRSPQRVFGLTMFMHGFTLAEIGALLGEARDQVKARVPQYRDGAADPAQLRRELGGLLRLFSFLRGAAVAAKS